MRVGRARGKTLIDRFLRPSRRIATPCCPNTSPLRLGVFPPVGTGVRSLQNPVYHPLRTSSIPKGLHIISPSGCISSAHRAAYHQRTALHIISPSGCISSAHRAAYHQRTALYIISPLGCISSAHRAVYHQRAALYILFSSLSHKKSAFPKESAFFYCLFLLIFCR